jgi:hypothetical protein
MTVFGGDTVADIRRATSRRKCGKQAGKSKENRSIAKGSTAFVSRVTEFVDGDDTLCHCKEDKKIRLPASPETADKQKDSDVYN